MVCTDAWRHAQRLLKGELGRGGSGHPQPRGKVTRSLQCSASEDCQHSDEGSGVWVGLLGSEGGHSFGEALASDLLCSSLHVGGPLCPFLDLCSKPPEGEAVDPLIFGEFVEAIRRPPH